jgi:alcohol dehydrogenase class IV
MSNRSPQTLPPARPFVGPGRVLAGPGASASVGAELLSIGVPDGAPVLVVADAAVLSLGLAEPALQGLTDAGFSVRVGPGVAREPTPETVRDLEAAAGGEPVAAVVAIGGGSAIDAAKLVALAQANELALETGLVATASMRPGPPLSAIPTTAGTGAEATWVAMLWHEGAKRMFVHEQLVPRHAILDPHLLAAVPAPVTAASGLDAISHAVESLLSTFRAPLTEGRSRSALRRLSGALPATYSGGDDASRMQMLLGAYEAGLGLNASVVLGHSLAYCIAARTGLSHGVTCAMALPYTLAYCRPASEPLIASLGDEVGTECDGTAVLDWLVSLTEALDIPVSLDAVGIASGDLPALAQECATRYPRPNNPVPITPEALEGLLAHFHAGDPRAAWDRAGQDLQPA